MDINTYSQLALRTAAPRSTEDMILEAAMGIGGEGGEIVDLVKKVKFYGKPLDKQALKAELGDNIWYMNLMIKAAGLTWDEVLEANIRKLEARFPGLAFDADQAINRDVDAEKIAVEG